MATTPESSSGKAIEVCAYFLNNSTYRKDNKEEGVSLNEFRSMAFPKYSVSCYLNSNKRSERVIFFYERMGR